MARSAVLRDLTVLIVEVALLAVDDCMLALKRVLALQVMFKGDNTPFIRHMTFITGLIDLTNVKVLMTVTASGVNRLKVSTLMTSITGY
jgi:hypothetical protein